MMTFAEIMWLAPWALSSGWLAHQIVELIRSW